MSFNRVTAEKNELQFYCDNNTRPTEILNITGEFKDITIHKISGSSLVMMRFVFTTRNVKLIIESSIQDQVLKLICNMLYTFIIDNDALIAKCQAANTQFKSIKENLGG